MTENKKSPPPVSRVDRPEQFEQSGGIKDIEIDAFIWATNARDAFGVSGNGLGVAVLDTGLRTTHVDFAGRVPAQYNATSYDDCEPSTVTDRQGHGTNVAGLIAANDVHVGIAPGAAILPVKVLGDDGNGSWEWLEKGLHWVVENRTRYNITAVCMSLGDSGNYTTDENGWFTGHGIQKHIQTLHANHVAVVIAAGNEYFTHGSQQGMGFPAILQECVSVGAVYDSNVGGFHYYGGAKTITSSAGQVTPFSQRLHPSLAPNHYTDIFAPGAPATSSGIDNNHGESTQRGTSQAAPVTAGVILLMQEYYLYETGELPTIAQLTDWLRAGAVPIYDGDDENDNVAHTHLEFLRIDALSALNTVRQHLQQEQYKQKRINHPHSSPRQSIG